MKVDPFLCLTMPGILADMHVTKGKTVRVMLSQQSDLELIKVDAALNDGLGSPAGLHKGYN